MTGTTPICAYCGRPVLGPHEMGHAGEVYHLECTAPPHVRPQRQHQNPYRTNSPKGARYWVSNVHDGTDQ